jgi:hypothetical protein
VARRVVAEALGTAFLLAAVVGSGIMGDRLAGGNVAIALLANTIATGAMLVALILTFGPISGAHFNPAVTLADATQGGLAWREVPVYIAAQVAGVCRGRGSASDVRRAGVFRFASCPRRSPAALQRIHRDVRASLHHLGLRPLAIFGGAVCSRCLHHRSLLVHVVNFVCKSGRNAGPRRVGYVRRYSTGRRAGVHHRAARRSDGRNAPFPMARSITSEGRRQRRRCSPSERKHPCPLKNES